MPLDASMKRIRRVNEGMETISHHACQIETRQMTSTLQRTPLKALPANVQATRFMLESAHEAVYSNFNCQQPKHVRHSAAIAVKVRLDETESFTLSLSRKCLGAKYDISPSLHHPLWPQEPPVFVIICLPPADLSQRDGHNGVVVEFYHPSEVSRSIFDASHPGSLTTFNL